MTKLYIIAGEESGDFIGGNLIHYLNEADSNLKFYGIGGTKMQDNGLKPLFGMEKISIMGYVEVILNLPRLIKLINKTVEDIISKNPSILITIDSPGFTYRVAQKIRKFAPHIKLVHIVAPSVWAYKPGRAKKYAGIYDNLLTLLPFEPEYFIKEGLESTCIGHPVLEQNFSYNNDKIRKDLNINPELKIIAVTPGSRVGEIKRHMPIIVDVMEKLSRIQNIRVVFVQPNERNIAEIKTFLRFAKFKYLFSTERLKIFSVADCALAKSGTNILEIAASRTPQIVGYKLNFFTFWLVKKMIKIRFASLINIIPDKEIIPEYIQEKFKADYLVPVLNKLLNDDNARKKQITESMKVLHKMGLNSNNSPSKKAVEIILNMLG